MLQIVFVILMEVTNCDVTISPVGTWPVLCVFFLRPPRLSLIKVTRCADIPAPCRTGRQSTQTNESFGLTLQIRDYSTMTILASCQLSRCIVSTSMSSQRLIFGIFGQSSNMWVTYRSVCLTSEITGTPPCRGLQRSSDEYCSVTNL